MSAVLRRTTAGLIVVGLGAVSLGAFLAAAALAGVGIPLVHLPTPTGSFAVGTGVISLAHDLSVQLWYPAAPSASGPRAPYRLGDRPGSLRARISGAFVRTNSSIGVPIADGTHPVIIYAAGWGGTRSENSAQAENLASNGFIVIGMDDAHPQPAMDMNTADAYARTLRWADEKARLEARTAVQLVSTLDDLAADRPHTPLAGHVDAKRIGMFGFSFGGAVAAETAFLDPRVAAALDLDGWIFADAAQHGIRQPFMVVSSASQDDLAARAAMPPEEHRFTDELDDANWQQMLAGFERYGGYLLTVTGTNHYNFDDTAVLPSIRHRGVGPIDGRRGEAIVAAYVLAFFDRYLKGSGAPLIDAAPASGRTRHPRAILDPAAELQIWEAPSLSVRFGAAA